MNAERRTASWRPVAAAVLTGVVVTMLVCWWLVANVTVSVG